LVSSNKTANSHKKTHKSNVAHAHLAVIPLRAILVMKSISSSECCGCCCRRGSGFCWLIVVFAPFPAKVSQNSKKKTPPMGAMLSERQPLGQLGAANGMGNTRYK
jgi:hypothetical protein